MATDFLIIGAGIVGLTIATELRARHPTASIVVLEKEPDVGLHASGRNSGVLHTGIYYPKNSLKAQFCGAGALALRNYCEEFKLPHRRIGKLIVATSTDEFSALERLRTQAMDNHVRIEMIEGASLEKLEPCAFSPGRKAMYVPDSVVVEPKAILNHLRSQLEMSGVEIRFNTPLRALGKMSFGHLFNAAGVHADTIARGFGVRHQYIILPFKGVYYLLNPKSSITIQHNVYPVPDLRFPFLGIHFSPTLTHSVTIGPTALPALGREHYEGLKGVSPLRTLANLGRLTHLYVTNRDHLREHVHRELGYLSRRRYAAAARKLIPNLQPCDLIKSKKVGIRAQLFDRKAGTLVMDFKIDQGENSTHILNAVSPAFTCAFPFAKYVVDQAFSKS